MFTTTIHTTATIDAPPETVWDVLTDLDSYSDWNPFIVVAAGTPALGARLDLTLRDVKGRENRFRPRVTTFDETHEFAWLGRLGVPGLFDGEHRFALRPDAGRTLLEHTEIMRGALVPVLRERLARDVAPAFEAMNVALAARVHDVSAANA